MPYADPAKQREYSRQYAERWRTAHPERARANAQRYRSTNPERCRAQQRAWYHRNGDKERAKDREQSRRRAGLTPTRPEPDACECCGTPVAELKKALCLDHNHATGEFRGWICHACNLMLGYARDDSKRLMSAANYLAWSALI